MSFRTAFNTFPHLTTQRLILRQLQETDGEACYRQLTEPRGLSILQ